MPGYEPYVSNVTEYRMGIGAADAQPPANTLPTIGFPSGLECKSGADNKLYLLIRLNGGGMNITAQLWRVVDGDVYSVPTGALWGATAQSVCIDTSFFSGLAVGEYIVTVTGNFNNHTVDIFEQHTE